MGLLDTEYVTVNAKKPRNSDRIQPGQPMNMRGLLDAATSIPVAGDALSGGMALYDAAKGDYGSAAMNALGVLPFVTGTFIGKGAKTWDAIKAADAEKRIAAGDDVRKVWKETGTFKGPDGHLRQEIDDSRAAVQPDGVLHRSVDKEAINNGAPTSFPQWVYMDHPELYKSYEGAKKLNIRPTADFGSQGSYNNAGTIEISAFADNPKSTNLHELQHVIQQREGWAKGGSNDEFLRPMRQQKQEANNQLTAINEQLKTAKGDEYLSLLDKRSELIPILQTDSIDIMEQANNKYKRLAGEAEARATQARMNMNMEQRLNTYPLDSYDVPVDQLIIRGLLNQ